MEYQYSHQKNNMSKSIKFKDEAYIDSTGIVENETKLNQVLENLRGKLLYSGGSTTNILAPSGDSFANYNYLLIVGGWWGNTPSSILVPYIEGQDYSISAMVNTASNAYWMAVAKFVLSSNQITISNSFQFNLVDATGGFYDCFRVIRVYGFK